MEEFDEDAAVDIDWSEMSEVYLGVGRPLAYEDCEISRISLREAVQFVRDAGYQDRRIVTADGVEYAGRSLETLMSEQAGAD
ncbi:hypothetical protein WG908_07465 [Sphingobium sp. AN641]|uniref:hypothetical protein n=1 Tax=Sphingobium sp. AN641 TaxID=3133443 RepID=UPI0030C14D2B